MAKGVVFTLDALFALILTTIIITLILYVRYVPQTPYALKVADAGATLKTLLATNVSATAGGNPISADIVNQQLGSGETWPMFMNNVYGSGSNQYGPIAPFITANFTAANIITTPIVAGYGNIYFGAVNVLYAVTANGTMVWTRGSNTFIGEAPALSNGELIYANSTNLTAVNAYNGSLIWTTNAFGGQVDTPILIYSDLIFVGVTAPFAASTVDSLYLVNGTIKSAFALSGSQTPQSLKINSGSLILATTSGNIIGIGNINGNPMGALWSSQQPGTLTNIATDGNLIAYGTGSDFNLTYTNGSKFYSINTGHQVLGVATYKNDVVYQTTNGVVLVHSTGTGGWTLAPLGNTIGVSNNLMFSGIQNEITRLNQNPYSQSATASNVTAQYSPAADYLASDLSGYGSAFVANTSSSNFNNTKALDQNQTDAILNAINARGQKAALAKLNATYGQILQEGSAVGAGRTLYYISAPAAPAAESFSGSNNTINYTVYEITVNKAVPSIGIESGNAIANSSTGNRTYAFSSFARVGNVLVPLPTYSVDTSIFSMALKNNTLGYSYSVYIGENEVLNSSIASGALRIPLNYSSIPVGTPITMRIDTTGNDNYTPVDPTLVLEYSSGNAVESWGPGPVILGSDILCGSLTIAAGTFVTTSGYSILCQNTITIGSGAVITGGGSPPTGGNPGAGTSTLQRAYGGSGGGGGSQVSSPGGNGHNGLPSSSYPSGATLAANLATWYETGMSLYLDGAGGGSSSWGTGSSGAITACGGSGALGLYVQAGSIINSGTFDYDGGSSCYNGQVGGNGATGAAGNGGNGGQDVAGGAGGPSGGTTNHALCGGGGGGAYLIFAYGTSISGISGSTVETAGGSGDPTGQCANHPGGTGGAGGFTTYDYASTQPIGVASLLTANIIWSSPSTISQGATGTLTASVFNGYPSYTYNFFVKNSLNSNIIATTSLTSSITTDGWGSFTVPNGVANPNAIGVAEIYATITDAGGYSVTEPLNAIQILPGPLTAGSPPETNTVISTGQSSVLSNLVSGGLVPYSFQWYTKAGATAPTCTGANLIPGATGSTYTAFPTTTNSYAYKVTDSEATPVSICTDGVGSDPAGNTITVNLGSLTAGAPIATNTAITIGQETSLTEAASGGHFPYTYTWYQSPGGVVACVGAEQISGQTAATLAHQFPTVTTTYAYQVVDSEIPAVTECSPGTTITVTAAFAPGAPFTFAQQATNSIPIVSGSIVYTLWNNNFIVASNLTTGSTLWITRIPYTSNAQPYMTLAYGKLFVILGNRVEALGACNTDPTLSVLAAATSLYINGDGSCATDLIDSVSNMQGYGVYINNGMVNSVPSYAPANDVAFFNGKGGIVQTADGYSEQVQLSISFWMDPVGNTGGSQFPIDSTPEGTWRIGFTAANTFLLDPGVGSDVSIPTQVSFNHWQFVTLTAEDSGSNIVYALYVNRSQVASGKITGSMITSVNDLTMSSSNFPYNGFLANVQLYNAYLTVPQIGELYQEGIAGEPLPLSGAFSWFPLEGDTNDYINQSTSGYSFALSFSSGSSVTYSASNYIPAGLSNAYEISKDTALLPARNLSSGRNNLYNIGIYEWK